MGQSGPVEPARPSVETAETTRHGIEQAEAGDASGADEVESGRRADPAGVEAIEQEAADGPDGRGLAR